MWVWSDELEDRVLGEGVGSSDRVPLVAYAVSSGADLDELAVEVLGDTGVIVTTLKPDDRGAVNR